MRLRIYAILAMLLVCFLCAHAQEPPKGTNTIYLLTSAESLNDAHDIVMRTLIANDVDVRSDNQDYFYIKSAGRPTKSGSDVTCSIVCMEKDGAIVIRVTGTYKSPLDNFRSEDKVIKQGMKGSIAMQVWKSMLDTAMLIPHTSIEYAEL